MAAGIVFCQNRADRYVINAFWQEEEGHLMLQSASHVMRALSVYGPFVGIGKFGPASYVDPPFQLEKPVGGSDIYGWRPGAIRCEMWREVHILVIGAKYSGDIYFTLAEDVTTKPDCSIRAIAPLLNEKIFTVSHEAFCERLVDIFPSHMIPNFVSRLILLPDNFLDNVARIGTCRRVGQEICNSHTNAFQVMCDVHSAVAEVSHHRRGFARAIETAWDGIGEWKG